MVVIDVELVVPVELTTVTDEVVGAVGTLEAMARLAGRQGAADNRSGYIIVHDKVVQTLLELLIAVLVLFAGAPVAEDCPEDEADGHNGHDRDE